jgi:hypothetical protein
MVVPTNPTSRKDSVISNLKGKVSFEDSGEAVALELADLGHDRLLVVGRDVVEVDLESIL